jgi:hypothetical protein
MAEWASGALEIHRLQSGHWPGFGFVFIVLTEFRRAVAAEQRYEYLKGRGTAALACEGIARADVARRIFEEFYSRRADECKRVPGDRHSLQDGQIIGTKRHRPSCLEPHLRPMAKPVPGKGRRREPEMRDRRRLPAAA